MNTDGDYRIFLRDLIVEKQKKNPRLSLRNLARTFDIHVSHLSMVLQGKRDFSVDAIERVSDCLQLGDESSKRLLLLHKLTMTKSPVLKEKVIAELNTLPSSVLPHRDITVDQFRVISEWYHLPIHILIDMPSFEFSEKAVSTLLGISTLEVQQALERLEALDLIERSPEGKYRRTTEILKIHSPDKDDALRKHHTTMFQKGIESFTEQSPDTRLTSSMNLAFSTSGLKKAKALLNRTKKQLSEIATESAKEKKLYHLNLNLFSLMKTGGRV